MAIKVTVTEWEIPNGNDCEFADGKPCPFLAYHEYRGSAYCKIERSTYLETSKRQTWKKTPLCKLRT
jgi:hypothetical protein